MTMIIIDTFKTWTNDQYLKIKELEAQCHDAAAIGQPYLELMRQMEVETDVYLRMTYPVDLFQLRANVKNKLNTNVKPINFYR